MLGLVPEGVHPQQSADAAAQGCGAHQGSLRDSPKIFPGFDLVHKHKQEGRCIDYKEVKKDKLISQCCCLGDIVNAIENDTTPVLSPEHARHVLEIMTKIPEAIKTGATVTLETTF